MPGPAPKDGRTLLVVDDDVTYRARLVRALRDRGLEVTAAGDYEEAVAAAQADTPELALVDLRLPTRSGLDVVRMLKELDPTTIVVVLTGYGSIATASRVSSWGGDVPHQTGRRRSDSRGVRWRETIEPGSREIHGIFAGPRGMGTHSARARRLRREPVAGRPSAWYPPAIASTQALKGPRARKSLTCGRFGRPSGK